jgi:phage regulator Rha-like protein
MNNLVELHDNEPMTNTQIVAEGLNLSHHSVMILVDKYKDRLNEERTLEFKILKSGGRPVRIAWLDEWQFLFLATLMRNSSKVLDFKQKLTKEFIRQRKLITRLLSQRQNADWIEKREQGKLSRREGTDTIQKFVEYAKAQGSTKPDMYYVSLSKMENKALFIVQDKFPNLRDILDGMQLMIVASADIAVAKALQDGMDRSLPYKEIYVLAKERLEQFAEIVGKSLVPRVEPKLLAT